jgi:hypothetical protein
MKILVATLIKRLPNGEPLFYPRAMHSIYSLRFRGIVDYFVPSGGDDEPIPAVTHKYQQARQMVLAGDYDALLTAESDMILPPDALDKLFELNTDVAYGLYVWRHGRHLWNAYTELSVDYGKSLTETPERARQVYGQPLEVKGIGLGCTLIRRYVLDSVDFRHRTHSHADWCFAQDAAYAGAEQVNHLGVVCGHIGKGVIYWPDVSTDTLYREEAL